MPRRIFLEREIKSLLAASDSMWPKPVVDHMEGFGQTLVVGLVAGVSHFRSALHVFSFIVDDITAMGHQRRTTT